MGSVRLLPLFNRILSLCEARLKRTRLLARPIEIALEPTLQCNSDCIMCNRNFNFKKAKEAAGFLDWKIFNKVKPYFKSAESVLFGGFGEALLHPDYFSMLRAIKREGPFVYFFTNGILMKDEAGKNLVDSGIDMICISMGGATKQTYKKIRGVDGFEQVVQNIEKINEYKIMKNKKTPVLSFNVVAMNSIMPELASMVRLANKIGVEHIAMPNMVAQGKEMIVESIWENVDEAKSTIEQASTIAEKYNIKFIPPNLKIMEKDCKSLFHKMFINWDGTVMSCALEKYIVGDVSKNSLSEIWNSKGMIGLRKKYYEHGLKSVCPRCSCWDNKPDNFLYGNANTRLHAKKI